MKVFEQYLRCIIYISINYFSNLYIFLFSNFLKVDRPTIRFLIYLNVPRFIRLKSCCFAVPHRRNLQQSRSNDKCVNLRIEILECINLSRASHVTILENSSQSKWPLILDSVGTIIRCTLFSLIRLRQWQRSRRLIVSLS